MSEIRPFLSSLPGAKPVTSFGAALEHVPSPTGHSPWSPQQTSVPAMSAVEAEALRAEAVARGREDGLRETAALRAKLQQLIDGLATAEADAGTMRSKLIAEAAAAVVDAWTERAGTMDTFLPVIRAWHAKSSGPATAHVNPSEADSLRAAIGGTNIEVVADPAVPVRGMQLRSATHELTHHWDRRLAELREAIVDALEVKP